MRRLLVVLALAASFSVEAQSLRELLEQAAGVKTGDEKAEVGLGVDAETAASGIKEALARGARSAVNQLGRSDGFLQDEAVKILLPKQLRRLEDAARLLGAGKRVDALVLSMNRAAENAVPEAADILADAVRGMSVQDAIGIVRGGDTAGTDYFRRVTSETLRQRFLPIVEKNTESSGVARHYDRLLERTGGLQALGLDAPDLDEYVTEKAMDGLFHYIGEQEKGIRADPIGTGSDLLRRVFGT